MTELASAVCSITPTQRRRFFWAAWWTCAPRHSPFARPDASNGGAASEAEALADAERLSGRHLVTIEGYWARAWKCVLRGEAVPPLPLGQEVRAARKQSRGGVSPVSPWALLGLDAGADADEIKRAFRKRALETHPDTGGDPAEFLAVRAAYERLLRRR